MAKKLGTIKSISGSAEVIAVDKSGNQRVLKVGDSLYEGESVKTTSADSKVVIATNNGKELSMIGEDTLTLDPKATAGDSQVAALQKALLNGTNLEDLEETAAGGNSGGRGDGMSLGETRFEHGGHYSNISASTSAINPLGAASFAGPAEGKSGGLDSGRGGSDDNTAGAGNTINPETTRKPSNPEIKFPEDTNKDGKISDDENKAGDKDAGKTTVEVTIPKDGSVKPGDKVVVTDDNGKKTEKPINQDDIDKGKIDIPVDLNPGKDNNVTAEIINPNNPNNPGKDSKVIGEDSENTKAPEAPVITEVIDDVKGYGEDTKVGNVLDVKGHLTNDKTPTIKGTAKAGSKVEIYDNGDRIGETTAKDNGSWEFEAPALTKQGEHKFTATAENKFGKSTPSNEATIDLDSIAPKLDNVKITPIDTNSKADDTAELTMGTGHTDTPNAEILFRDENNNIIGKGHANSSGDFLIQLDKAVQPGTPVFVQAIDKAGNAGTEMATAGNIEHPNDHTAPSEPTITFVEDTNPKDGKLNKAENGSDSDNANTTAKISIPTDAVVNDVIKYTVNGEEKSHPITDADKAKGHIEVKVPVVDGQTSTITAKIVDQAGNASKEVSGSVDVDLTIGNPKVRFLEDADNNGVLSVAEVAAIKDGKAHWVIDIPTDGSVKAGDVIQSIDGKGNWVKFVEITDEMIKDGRFEATFNVDIEKLRNGKYETPEYRFADDAGNISDSSKATLTLDSELTRQPSNPSITFPEDTNKDGKISDDENKAGDKDAGKTTVEVTIPKDGSVKPGDKVVVTDDNGKKTEKPINQDDIDKGKIDIPVDLNPGKDNNVTAEIINPNNPNNPGKDSKVIGEASSTVKVTIDEIIDDVTGGVVNGDVKNGLTNDNLPTFKGSAAPGATVEIYESFYTTTEKTLVGKTVADANGKWSFTPTEAMGDGEHYFEAVATDKVGNKSTSDRVSLDVDTFADAPVIDAVNDNVDSQTGNVLDAKTKVALTNDSTPTLEGYAEPDSVITIYEISELNGEKTAIGTVTADNHGGWKFELPELGDGEYKYTTRAQDKAGNISDFSEVVVVNADLIAPSEPTITFVEDVNPKDGKLNKAENGKDGDSTSTKAQISVPGDAEENDVIHYTVNGEEKTHTITYNDRVTGYVEIKVPVVDGKASSVTAKIVDQAGNASKEVSSSIDSDFTAPNVKITGIIDNVEGGVYKGNVAGTNTNDNKPTIKGTADANQEVVLYDNNKEFGRATADKDGNWEFKPSDYKEPLADLVGRVHVIKAVVTDSAGNTSEATSALEVDTTIGAPKVSIKEDADNNGVLSVEEAKNLKDSKIHWEVEIPKDGTVSAGDVLQVLGKDGKWKTEKVLSNDDLGKSFEYEATLSGKHFESPSYRIVDLVGNQSTAIHANIQLDSEFSRKPSNPEIKFPEDTNKDGKISDDENKAGDKDAGKTTVEVTIPKDGSVKPGDKVVVTDDNGKKTEKPINQDDIDKGKIDIPVDLNPGKDNNVTAEIINPNNPNNPGKDSKVIGEASSTVKVTIDEIIDDVTGGVVNGDVKNGLTNDNLPTFKGSAAPGATVEIYESFYTTTEKTLVGKTVADANGKWSFTPTEAMGDGEHYFEAVATDKVGNKSTSDRVSLDVDTFADAPVIDAVNDNVDSQTGNVLDAKTKVALTNDSTPTLEGYAEPDSVITIYEISELNGEKTAIGTVTADNHGGWKFELPELGDGEYKYTTRAQDKAGNISDFSEVVVVNADLIAPSEPTITFVEDVNPKDGKLNKAENGKDGDSTSTKAQISVPGDAEENDVIHYTVNGEEKTHTITYNDRVTGYVEIKVPVVDGKASSVTAKLVDQAGNASKEVSGSVDVDTTIGNPKVRFVEDTNNDGVLSVAEVAAIKDGKAHWVIDIPTDGSVKAGDVIQSIDGKGNWVKFVEITDEMIKDGRFEATFNVGINKLKDGKYETPEYRFADEAGNVSDSSKASLSLDSEFSRKPSNPEIKFPEDTNKDGKISDDENKAGDKDAGKTTVEVTIPKDGSVKPGDKVVVTDDNGKKTEKPINQDDIDKGKIDIPVDLNPGKDNNVTAEIINPNNPNNPGKDSKVIGEDSENTKAPEAPVITEVIDDQRGGKFNEDVKGGLTNDSTPTFKGTAKPGTTITLKNGNDLIADNIPVKTDGSWEFTIKTPLAQGDYSITATAKNAAGKVSAPSDAATIKIDLHSDEPVITGIIDNVAGGVVNGDVKGGLTNDNTPTLKGTAEPFATVEIKIDGRGSYRFENGEVISNWTAVADKDGNWEFTTPKLSDGHHNFEAQATDVAGNNSQPSALVSIDVDTHIDAPVITAVTDNWWGGVENGGNILGVNDGFTNDTTPTFKGKAEAGSTIILKNGNDIIAEKVVVDSDGNWEFTPKSPLAEGKYNVVAIATDKAGNVSDPSNVATVNVDTSTTQPVITEIIDDVAGGVVGNVKNALTNDNLPTLKGTAEAFSTVKIIVDDKLVFKDGKEVTVTADKDGNWEYTFEANLKWGGEVHAALEDGVHTLKVQTTDRAGNRSAVSEWSSVDVDTTIGVPTVKITTDTNSDKKIDINDASALKDGKLKWVIDIPENTVKAGDRVQILGSDAKTWTDIFKVTAQDIAKGFIERDEFSIDMPKSRGFQTPSYRLVDDAGNVSEGSMDAVKIVGFAPKAPVIKAVLDNEYGIDPKDPISINAGDTTGNVLEGVIAITNDNTPTLMGKAEAGTTITLKKGNTVIADNIPVDANGSWHYEPKENSPWADGDYKITAIAKNIFGKESEPSSPITVTVDTTKPEVTLNSIEDNVKTNDVVDFTGNVKDKFTNDNTPVLKGTAEAGSTIIIKYGEHHENVVTTKADENGSWNYKITNPLSDGEQIISYQAVDKAGNASPECVANVTVDTKIVDLRIDYLGDKNHDGKYSWSDNISNENNVIYCCARFSKEAVDQGLIKVGDKLYYEVHSNVGAWNKGVVKEPITITELDLKRGYVDLTSVANITYPSKELIPFGKTANGFNLSAKAYLVDEAGNMGKQASEDLVFDFSDKPADPVKNIKINAEAIYGDNDTGLWLEGHGPVLKASTELQPQLNGNDNYEIDVKTITHKAEFTLGSGDDVVNIHKSDNGWGWINMDSKIDLGDGNNRLIVAADLDHSTVISGKGDDYIEIKDDVANGAKIITGAGNDTVIVGDTVANTIFTKVGISTGDGNDSVTIKGDAIDKAKIDLGNGDDTLTIKAAHVIGGIDDKGALDGGKGYDKLIISSPEDTIDLEHVSYHAKNFEELDISGAKNTTLKVGIKDVLDMTDDKHTLKITGDKGDVVDLKEDVKGSGWHQGASEDGYTTYTNNTVTIQIKDEIHVI